MTGLQFKLILTNQRNNLKKAGCSSSNKNCKNTGWRTTGKTAALKKRIWEQQRIITSPDSKMSCCYKRQIQYWNI